MSINRAFLLVVLVAASATALANENLSSRADSSVSEGNLGADSIGPPSYSLSEILVTGTRLPSSTAFSVSPVTVLTRAEIKEKNASSLADVVSTLPGVFVKEYGGLSGLKTISQRGLGAEHTLVLINGMRVSNPLNTLTDFGLIAAGEVERLELVRGGQSAGFGADAVAGVVNAVLGPPPEEYNIQAARSVGSFGHKGYLISGGANVAKGLGLWGSYREEKGDENFPFVFRNGNQRFDLVRHNTDFFTRTASLHSDFLLNGRAHLFLWGRTFSSERGVGGPIVGPTSVSVARQKDENNLVQLTIRSAGVSPLAYRLGLQFNHTFQRYDDRNLVIGAATLNNFSKTIEVRVEPGIDYSFGERTRIAGGAEFARATAMGNSLSSNVRRLTYAGYVAIQHQILEEGPVIQNLLLSPSLRYDAVTTGQETIKNWSPQFGAVCSFQGVLRPTVRATISENFRAPTINELFYAGGGGMGNPNLQPEHSTSMDAGFELALFFAGKHHLQCTYFNTHMNNRIIWVSAGGFTVVPKNVRKVRSSGVELSYRWVFFRDRLSIGINYTSLAVRKTEGDFPGDPNANTHLIYVPQESAHYVVAFREDIDARHVRQVGAGFDISFAGFRYTTEDNLGFLPSYTLTNVNVYTRLCVDPLLLLVRCEVNNLFNTEYQSVPTYPMPLRSYRATFGIEL